MSVIFISGYKYCWLEVCLMNIIYFSGLIEQFRSKNITKKFIFLSIILLLHCMLPCGFLFCSDDYFVLLIYIIVVTNDDNNKTTLISSSVILLVGKRTQLTWLINRYFTDEREMTIIYLCCFKIILMAFLFP